MTQQSCEPSVTQQSCEPSITHILLSNSSSAISYFLSKFEQIKDENIIRHGICAIWLGSLHCDTNYEEVISPCFSAIIKDYRCAEKHFKTDFFKDNFFNYYHNEMNLVSVFDHVIRSKKTLASLCKYEYLDEEMKLWYQKFSEFLNLQSLFTILKKVLCDINFEKDILRNDKNRTTKQNQTFSFQFDSPILYYVEVKQRAKMWSDVFMKNNNRTLASQNMNLYRLSKYILFLRNVVEETWERAIYPRDEYLSPAETGEFLKFHDYVLNEINCIHIHAEEPYFTQKETWTQKKWEEMKKSVYDE